MAETMIKHASKTALTLMAFAVVFTSLMTTIYFVTKLPIAKSEAEARMSLFSQIAPADLHTNDLLKDTIVIEPNALLGNKQPTEANIARIDGKPSAIILEAVASDGYAGDIKMLIAIKVDGTISGVRVIKHQETPGLGDYIDIAKDKWISIFNGKSLNQHPKQAWKVKKDGGQFDYMAGATITPRAVIKAVYKALTYVDENKNTLFASNQINMQNAQQQASQQKELTE